MKFFKNKDAKQTGVSRNSLKKKDLCYPEISLLDLKMVNKYASKLKIVINIARTSVL
jgi:hypothetical protein